MTDRSQIDRYQATVDQHWEVIVDQFLKNPWILEHVERLAKDIAKDPNDVIAQSLASLVLGAAAELRLKAARRVEDD